MNTRECLPKAGERCPACDGKMSYAGTAVASPFFAKRVLDKGPFLLDLQKCSGCDTLRYDATLGDQDLGRLYQGYRGDEYFAERSAFEPWYSERDNSALGAAESALPRTRALEALLAEHHLDLSRGSILDYGGADGCLVAPMKAAVKKTYDISGVQPVDGVLAATGEDLEHEKFDLVVSSHVLEHITDPLSHLKAVVETVKPGGAVYVEVPDEAFRLSSLPRGLAGRWLGWVVRHPRLTMLVDFLSTGCRIKLGVVPPGGAPFLREHVIYYTLAGLVSLGRRAGLEVLCCRKLSTGNLGLLGLRR